MSYKIKYGTRQQNIDITKIALEKCMHNTLVIPGCNNTKNILFSDPVHGVSKNIFLEFNNELREYDSNTDIVFNLHPITFSIPEEKISPDIKTKTKILSNLIPGDRSTYIYTNETDYYNEYKQSIFATTTLKAGWDCLRHYEILANGTIPYFPGIEECPPNTLKLFPKEMIKYGNELYNNYRNKQFHELNNEELDKCYNLINQLLDYTKNNLTTAKMAQYVLNTVNYNGSNILYLSGNTDPDYLRCLTLHGFKTLFGRNCHDYPKIEHIYKSSTVDFAYLYGGGITYTNLLDNSLHDHNLDASIIDDILNHKYDIIIYGSYHRVLPFYDFITQHYTKDKIILMCGEDLHCCDYMKYVSIGHHVFVREL